MPALYDKLSGNGLSFASDIGIMNNGKIIKEKPLEEIHKENKDKIVARVDDISKASILLEERGIQDFKIMDDGQIHIFDLTYDTSCYAELFVPHNKNRSSCAFPLRSTLSPIRMELIGFFMS